MKLHLNLQNLLIHIAIPLCVGVFSSLLTQNPGELYQELQKPPLSPPSILFPIIWTILYVLMGISSYLIDQSSGNTSSKNLSQNLYKIQLVLNFIWSPIFFNLQSYGIALMILILLWIVVALMTQFFKKLLPLAAYLQIPYLLWLIFAGYLNLMIFILN